MTSLLLTIADLLRNRPTALIPLIPVFIITLTVFFVVVVPLSRRLRVKYLGAIQLLVVLSLSIPFFSVVGALVYGYSTGFATYYRYIHEHGVQGEFVLARYRETGSRINGRELVEGVGYLKLQDGRSIETVMPAGPVPQYPLVDAFTVLPGKVYGTRYLPDAPNRFVIDQGSAARAAQRGRCGPLIEEVQSLNTRLLLQPQDATLRREQSERTAEMTAACAQ